MVYGGWVRSVMEMGRVLVEYLLLFVRESYSALGINQFDHNIPSVIPNLIGYIASKLCERA